MSSWTSTTSKSSQEQLLYCSSSASSSLCRIPSCSSLDKEVLVIVVGDHIHRAVATGELALLRTATVYLIRKRAPGFCMEKALLAKEPVSHAKHLPGRVLVHIVDYAAFYGSCGDHHT